MDQNPDQFPVISIEARAARRVRTGHPWVFSNEFAMTPELKALVPGSIVRVKGPEGHDLGLFMFNPRTLIAARRLTRDVKARIDADFLGDRLELARTRRDRLFARPFYRFVHAEADGFPGLVIDRFGDTLVVQVNSAGFERLTDSLIAALDKVLAPARIILKNDSPARELEGLTTSVDLVRGANDGPIAVEENGITYFCDPLNGQKTGWFYDHRDNRAFIAGLAAGARVVDFYSYAGAFALACARAGAAEVVAVDRSEGALQLAAKAAAHNGLEPRLQFRRADAFAEMERMGREGERFDIVIADPPAFVKSKKHLKSGAQGYRKMTRLAAALVKPGGYLLVASCSHHMTPDLFAAEVRQGLADARREGAIIRMSGAGPDHPVHPFLPESAYLKAQVIAL